MIRIAIVEDNSTLRQTLATLLEQTDGLHCVCALPNLLNVVSEIRKATPDIVLMDIGLPNISGIEGVRTIKENFPKIEILMFTVFEDDDKIFEAIQSGASGYLVKKSTPSEIIDAIFSLADGGAPMSASIARKVVQSFQKTTKKTTLHLTTRESEILYSLVDGMSYKKLAEKYFISVSTVRTHIRNIYKKLEVNSKAEAVARLLKD
ncbi:MAG: response regulator transcription factor [Bacteroidetes bacterium]|nr:response regulator transcription factor [Bacteroidota bacterium]